MKSHIVLPFWRGTKNSSGRPPCSLLAVSRMREFDDVLLRFMAWEKKDADQIRNNIVAEHLEALAVEHEPGNDRMQ